MDTVENPVAIITLSFALYTPFLYRSFVKSTARA